MKKTLRLLVVTFLAIFLTACNIQTVEQFEKMEEQEQSVDHSPTDEKVEQMELVADSDTTEDEQKQDDTTQKEEKPKETVTEETKQQQATETKTEKQEQTVSPQPNKQQTVTGQTNNQTKPQVTEKPQQPNKQQTATGQTNNQTKPQVTEKPQQRTEQTPKKRSVTIAIRVDTLLKNWDLLDPSLQSEKYVPNNGVILKTTTYELLSDNDTVWDVLQRATKEHKIQMEYQGPNENIYNSVYVEGINHLYEFSAGPLSGWMYKVNGVYPNYGCSQYTLKDGDVIEWHYTVDLGRDLGQEWIGE